MSGANCSSFSTWLILPSLSYITKCLTCGARNEHPTRSCPISKTCFTCGMKGHINAVREVALFPVHYFTSLARHVLIEIQRECQTSAGTTTVPAVGHICTIQMFVMLD
jgi:hypothetical protein